MTTTLTTAMPGQRIRPLRLGLLLLPELQVLLMLRTLAQRCQLRLKR